MERSRHDPVGGIEGFLDTVSVMYIHVDVQYSWMYAVLSVTGFSWAANSFRSTDRSSSRIPSTLFHQIKLYEDERVDSHIVDVAETTRFGLFGVM
jgi:hypothetical protein